MANNMLSKKYLTRTLTFQRIAGGLLIFAGLAFATLLTASQVSAQTPPSDVTAPSLIAQQPELRDFFGTVLSVQPDFLVLKTKAGTVEVSITGDTKVRLPLIEDASVTDLAEGDLVAVSLDEEDGTLTGAKIHLVPDKTQFRQVPGVVLPPISDTSITILPPGEGVEPITFELTPATNIRLHRGATAIVEGSFVVIGTSRDPVTGEILTEALEVNVTGRPPRVDKAPRDRGPKDAPEREGLPTVTVRGAFEGVDAQGNLIINGRTVQLAPDAEIADGLVLGQPVEVEGVLDEEGNIVAQEVEPDDEIEEVSKATRLNGVFEGIDEDTGQWMVSGTLVTVVERTDTDGLPTLGQRVKVKALLQRDGSLLAREVENKSIFGPPKEDSEEVKLSGTFQGVDEEGNWIVNGRRVAVDVHTRLEGSPAVGQRIRLEAQLTRDGSLRALEVEGQKGGPRRDKNKVKVRGTIDEVLDDGTLVIDGVAVALGDLTELEGDAQVGDFVEVEALIQEDGTLLAKEVESEGQLEEEDVEEPDAVEIEGTVESVNLEDNTLVVNGIRVALSALSETRGDLVVGESVKVRGILRENGSLLARKLNGRGRKATASGNEVKVEGVLDEVNRDEDGNVISVVVNGLTVGVEALTETEGSLEPGASVDIKAIIAEGAVLASKVEVDDDADTTEDAEETELEVEGNIEALKLDDQGRVIGVSVNGIEVAIDPSADVEGLVVGEPLEIKGRIRGGNLIASNVEAKGAQAVRRGHSKFDLNGLVEEVERNSDGNVVAVIVDGERITAEAFTRVRAALEIGSSVEIRGVITNGERLASRIKPGKDARGRSRGQATSEAAREKAEERREDAKERAEERREDAEEKAEEVRRRAATEADDERDEDEVQADEERKESEPETNEGLEAEDQKSPDGVEEASDREESSNGTSERDSDTTNEDDNSGSGSDSSGRDDSSGSDSDSSEEDDSSGSGSDSSEEDDSSGSGSGSSEKDDSSGSGSGSSDDDE